MDPEERARAGRERDLVLAPNEYAMILDETKGRVSVLVGPHKTSLAGTDQPVIFEQAGKSFRRCNLEQAIKVFPYANQEAYVVLENPADVKTEGSDEHPKTGSNDIPKLRYGCKVNIPGPATFPLWPGQIAEVVGAHHLRTNQYLVVRVYNEQAAKENWERAVIKPRASSGGEGPEEQPKESEKPDDSVEVRPDTETPDLTMGQLMVVKGTDVSFFIPPTGIEVVPERKDGYVRDAVTLERLEYCILLDENGNKRFVRGPDVVFPSPTETFVEQNNSRKFKAIELNENMGIYVKVIADYEDDEDGRKKHKAGEELFITGKEMKIYFPRPEHAIVKYGEEIVQFAVAVPEGEARYVLDKLGGKVNLVKGPCMLLADPRKEVIVRRVLDPRTVELWFPGNTEALDYNRYLAELIRGGRTGSERADNLVTERRARKSSLRGQTLTSSLVEESVLAEQVGAMAEKGFAAEDFERRQAFTAPRTVTLDTKYEGAVAINVWTGYAIQVVSKTGERKVVVGPQTVLLEYDETLEILELSTGTPKTDMDLMKTVYLRVQNNKVSDVVEAETKDLVDVSIKLSYRVNFEGEQDKWFNVENYVKFLTDHLRSMTRNAVKQHGIEDFNDNAIQIIRDTILGVPGEEGQRPGRAFEENGMRVYDVEVLDVEIGDSSIEKLLINTQHESVQQALQIGKEERQLEVTKRSEGVKQQIADVQAETVKKKLALQKEELEQQREVTLAKIENEARAKEEQLKAELAQQENLDKINEAELARAKAKQDQELAVEKEKLDQRIAEIKAQAEGLKEVTPQFTAALQSFADKDLVSKLSENMSPLAILGGESLADVVNRMFKGTAFEAVLSKFAPKDNTES